MLVSQSRMQQLRICEKPTCKNSICYADYIKFLNLRHSSANCTDSLFDSSSICISLLAKLHLPQPMKVALQANDFHELLFLKINACKKQCKTKANLYHSPWNKKYILLTTTYLKKVHREIRAKTCSNRFICNCCFRWFSFGELTGGCPNLWVQTTESMLPWLIHFANLRLDLFGLLRLISLALESRTFSR